VSTTTGAGPAAWLRLWSIRWFSRKQTSGSVAAKMHWFCGRLPLVLP
jgi:hypothetical protein